MDFTKHIRTSLRTITGLKNVACYKFVKLPKGIAVVYKVRRARKDWEENPSEVAIFKNPETCRLLKVIKSDYLDVFGR